MDKPVWWSAADDDLIDVALSDEHRQLLWQGLHQWGGPTRPTDALANAIGFDSVEHLNREGDNIRRRLRSELPLTRRDWARALAATEIVWASQYFGAAGDWEEVSGWSDSETLQVLRSLQRALGGLRSPPRQRP